MKKIFTLLMITFLGGNSWAMHPTFVPVPEVPPSHLGVDNHYYEANLRGLGNYMNDLQADNPELYNKLSADYESLRYRQTLAWRVGGLSTLGGLVLSIGGVTFLASDKTVSGQQVVQTNNAAFYGGFALMTAGIISWAALAPGRSDLLNFVNEHNELDPTHPMLLQMGAIGAPGKFLASLALRF